MTERDVAILIGKMHTFFPAGNSKKDAKDAQKEVAAWYGLYKDFPREVVFEALDEYAMTNDTPFAPSPGQLHALINKRITDEAQIPSKFEAWDEVERMMCSSQFHYEPTKAFESLPKLSQQAVGNVSTLRRWSLSETSKLDYFKNQFCTRYTELAEAEEDRLKLPSTTLQILSTGGTQALNRPEGI